MSWDVLIMKEKYDFDAPEENQAPIPPLGQRQDIIARLVQALPDLNYRDEAWGILNKTDFSIEFNTGDDEITETIMLHIRGGGKVMDTLRIVCETLNAYALNTSDCTYIDFRNDDEAQASWVQFQQYRDRVINPNNRNR